MALSSQGGSTGAASGAAAGMQLGKNFGPWGALIGAAAGAVGGFIEGKNIEKMEKETLKRQNQIVAEQRKLQVEQNDALRRETARAYAENMKQRQYELQNTSKAISYISRVAGQQKADVTLQNAVADSIGASARAVYSAVDASADYAMYEQWQSLETALDNADTALKSMLNQAQSMVNTRSITNVQPTVRASDTQAALLGLADAGLSAYSSGMFDGFGKRKSAENK